MTWNKYTLKTTGICPSRMNNHNRVEIWNLQVNI